MTGAPVGRHQLSDRQRLAWLRLIRTDNVGPQTFRDLINRFGSAEAALDALPELARRGAGREALRPFPADAAQAEMETAARFGARFVAVGEADYPPLLRRVAGPPPLLAVKGDASVLALPAVSIVGARNASLAGIKMARTLARDIGREGYAIVSGLARGIDAAAHEGAMTTGTVAVLGGGVDDIYPPDHADLYARIADLGCVVSESPVGARAQARDFPRRNRIISGLSRGVVVVEAEIRSGSLITARLAAEQGRDVFAVPGSPLDPRARGPNELLRQGAVLCEGIEDIERAFDTLRTLRAPAPPPLIFDEGAADPAFLDRVAALLSPTPTPRDEIARALDAPVGRVAAALLELSLTGRAELLPGGLASS